MSWSPEHLPPIRRELLTWFQGSAPSLAVAYEGALRMIAESAFPGRVHFVAHAVRDIGDRLPFALDAHFEPERVQYEDAMDTIEREWPPLQKFTEDDCEDVSAEQVAVPYGVALRIDTLVEQHRSRRRKPSNHELLFRVLMRKEPSRVRVNKRLVSEFKHIHKWFQSRAHFPGKLAQVDDAELLDRFAAFEKMLHSLVGPYFTLVKELDEILQQANKRAG